MKLISMVDFVLEQGIPSNTDSQFSDKVMAYANFLKQPLKISMFVRAKFVNGEWVVLEVPTIKNINDCVDSSDLEIYEDELKEYQEAKDRVLFEGFKVYKEKSGLTKVFNSDSNIELYLPNNNKVERLAFGKIVLTESAKKQIEI